MHSWFRRHWPEMLALVGVVAVMPIIIIADVIPLDLSGNEKHESTRNLILMLAAAGALPFAVWRSRSGQRQADAADEQARAAMLARLNDQFTAAATMLGHESTSVRRLGLQSLQQLAVDHPAEYYVRVLRALSDYAREPYTSPSGESTALGPHGRLRSDVQGAVQMIGQAWQNKTAREEGLVKEPNYVPNLKGANLTKGRFWSLDLEQAHLEGAVCVEAVFGNVNLKGASLTGANLTGTDLTGDRESVAPVFGLTQEMLDKACADKGHPPKLDKVKDEKTGEQLKWREQPCPDLT